MYINGLSSSRREEVEAALLASLIYFIIIILSEFLASSLKFEKIAKPIIILFYLYIYIVVFSSR